MQGFGIAGFRSFGPEPQYIAPLEKVNLFVGQNNSGKSNVLRALEVVVGFARSRSRVGSQKVALDGALDEHKGRRKASLEVLLPLPVGMEALTKHFASHFQHLQQPQRGALINNIHTITQRMPGRAHDATWYRYVPPDEKPKSMFTAQSMVDHNRSTGRRTVFGLEETAWKSIWAALTNQNGGDFLAHHVPEVIDVLAPLKRLQSSDVYRVEASRQIGAAGSSYEGLSGAGLIQRLQQLQSPEFRHYQRDRQKFDQINDFLRVVTGSANARIDVPHSAQELLVEIDGKLLPIHSLGTGLHEVIIFAAAAAAFDNVILCLEEPEVHLHPRLQKRLLSYLSDQTDNQYFITTHSAHFLDAENAAVFHVQLNDHNETTVERVSGVGHRARVCFDLGYRPSDLMQANCVIWVEGPSDRVYLNAWIHTAAPELKEGEHYSVMFYGGRLLSHLTVSDDDVKEFIELQRLNRNVAIVMDSDCADAHEQPNATKQRVAQQTKTHGGLAWITAGREIENYIPKDVVATALATVHPSKTFRKAKDEWSCGYEAIPKGSAQVDKLAVARHVAGTVDLDVLDLRTRVDELVKFIRGANT